MYLRYENMVGFEYFFMVLKLIEVNWYNFDRRLVFLLNKLRFLVWEFEIIIFCWVLLSKDVLVSIYNKMVVWCLIGVYLFREIKMIIIFV